MLEVSYYFKGMDTSEAVREYAEKRSQKFEKYISSPTQVKWNFEVQHDSHHAKCHLSNGQVNDVADATSNDMYQSIDTAMEKLAHQLQKQKEKLTSHH